METTSTFILSNSDAILLVLAFGLFYLLIANFKMQINGLFYFGGLLLLTISLFLRQAFMASMPFTLHMSIHILLLLVCAPLMVIGWPKEIHKPAAFLKKVYPLFLSYPLICWLTGIGVMWFWHIPPIFNTLMYAHHQAFSLLNTVHLGSLLIAGLIFTWPIVSPLKGYRIDPPVGIIYLFTACIACSLLGLLITFAPIDTFANAMDMNSRDRINDQQAAGLMMWVPCCFLYLFGVLYLLTNWLKEPYQHEIHSSTDTLHSQL